MTKLKIILTGCIMLLGLRAQAADTPSPVKGLKCVFLAPRVPASFESSLVGSQKRLPAIAGKAGISGHSQVELTLDRDDVKRAAEIKAALSSGPIDLLALTVSAKETKDKGKTIIPGILGNASQVYPHHGPGFGD